MEKEKMDEEMNPIPAEERLSSRTTKQNKATSKAKKSSTKQNKGEKKMEEKKVAAEKKTRVRRSFTDIIIDKFDKKKSKVTAEVYEEIKNKVIAICTEFEKKIDESKDAVKAEKTAYKRLSKMDPEMIKAYLKSINK